MDATNFSYCPLLGGIPQRTDNVFVVVIERSLVGLFGGTGSENVYMRVKRTSYDR